MQTLEQQRAAYAWEQVQNCEIDYTNLAKGAPALIMANGLMQSLAFYEFKGKKHHKKLNKHILGWLCKQKLVESEKFKDAMECLYDTSPAEYRRATQEALELLKWVRQFAPAVTRVNTSDIANS